MKKERNKLLSSDLLERSKHESEFSTIKASRRHVLALDIIFQCCEIKPLFCSRENIRLLGTVRNKPGPPVLPHISKGTPSPSSLGRQSPESPPPGRRSSQGEELRRSLEDGRNMLAQRTNARRGKYTFGMQKRSKTSFTVVSPYNRQRGVLEGGCPC